MSVVLEAMDIVRASERLNALSVPLRSVLTAVANAREVAPDLAPELDAIDSRVSEAIDHVLAAQAVLSARLALLKDDE